MTQMTATQGLARFGRETLDWHGAALMPSFVVLLMGLALWFMPTPAGLTPQTWHLFTIFFMTIVAVILKPLPMGAVALISLALCIGTKTLTLEQSLSSFSSHVVWLVLFAFFLARGFIKTGLGSRIAFFFVSLLGRNTIGLSYGLILSDLILAPFVPSNTARGAGIVFPIVSALAIEQGSTPEQGTERKLGAFLIQVCFHANMITSAMFMTALVGNPLIASLAQEAGVELTWTTWAIGAVVPGLINLMILPLALYIIAPPEMLKTPEATRIARQKLNDLGSLSFSETLMLVIFLGIMGLWIFGQQLGVEPMSAALFGVACLLFSGILKWEDLIKEKGAWETLVWFAPLLMMATFLSKLGFMSWFSALMQTSIDGFHWGQAFCVLALVYFYSHYLFASVTARITAMYGPFLLVMIASGTPPLLAAMSLAVLSSVAGTLTNYGTGTAPVYFGAGYVPIGAWWRTSAMLSVINLAVWAVAGGAWWKIIGYW